MLLTKWRGPLGSTTTAGTSAPPYRPPGQLGSMSGSPAGSTGESQQPAGESQPPLALLPVKSPSSATMKMALCRVQARLDMIVCTAPRTNASALCLSRTSLGSSLTELKGHGVSGCPAMASLTPPCMSLHWSGVMYTNRGACRLFRSAARSVYGLMCATRAGLSRTSVYSANGLCLDAYSGFVLDGQKSSSGLAGSASM